MNGHRTNSILIFLPILPEELFKEFSALFKSNRIFSVTKIENNSLSLPFRSFQKTKKNKLPAPGIPWGLEKYYRDNS